MPPGANSITDERFDATVESVLSALDRWTARNDGHHTEKRTARRFPFRAPVTVSARHAATGATIQFGAHTRNISVSGLAFVVSKRIRAAGCAEGSLLAATLLAPECAIIVSLDRDGHNLRLIAKVSRLRKVHDDLYEFGVQFIGRDGDLTTERVSLAEPPALAQ